MKKVIISSLFFLAILSISLNAQDNFSWKKHLKLADMLYSKAQYKDAGDHYLAAFKKKTKKTELAYKAGECYYIVRDYMKASEAWTHVKDLNSKYPLIGLRYGRALKQSGKYEMASSELVNFIGNYQGQDKALVSQVVQTELRGCELAAQFAVKGEQKDIRIEYLNNNINSPETEFAPFPFGDEALYFSSTISKRAAIYRSLKVPGSDWAKATPLDNFPVIESDHFCNGTLTPDASRFYFTICKSEENWGGLTTRCQIYVTKRAGKSWSAPERLPDYINEANVTTTHPNVVHENGTEILYFSSNRPDGKGGMDVWYATREIKSTANDFTLPVNAGSQVNTLGDEITPYYDAMDGTLYFASNGQITIGGFDVYKAKGARANWNKAENMGLPINSPADDFFYIKTTSGKGGFFVSNRQFDLLKPSTTDEDIFYFEFDKPVRHYVARGEVYDKDTKNPLNDVEISIYEVAANGQRKFLTSTDSPSGIYDFPVEPSKKYYLEAVKDGFMPNTYEFDTYDFANFTDFGAPIYLESSALSESGKVNQQKEKPTSVVASQKVGAELLRTNTPPSTEKVVEKPVESKVTPEVQATKVNPAVETQKTEVAKEPTKSEDVAATKVKPASEAVDVKQPTKAKTETVSQPEEQVSYKKKEGSEEAPYVSRGRSKDDNLKILTEAPRKKGVYYKIQLAALVKYDPKQSRYVKMAQMGRLDTEYIVDLLLYRVLLADFETLEQARAALSKVRSNVDFKSAFIVEYNDGERIGLVK